MPDLTRVGAALVLTLFVSSLLWLFAICARTIWRMPLRPHGAVPWNASHLALILLVFLMAPLVLSWTMISRAPHFERERIAVEAIETQWLADSVAIGPAAAAVDDALRTAIVEQTNLTALEHALWLDGPAKLCIVLFAVVLFRWTADATWRDLGWDGEHFWRDVGYGVVAWFGVVPFLMLLKWALVATSDDPRPHQIVELLQHRPTLANWWLCGIAAIVMAPLIEEFLFRVAFQGWLQRAETPAWRERYWPHVPQGIVPIAVASLLFASLHSAWPDPIVIFCLSMSLGWLYQRTGSIIPSMTLHVLNNGISFFFLWLSTVIPK